MAVAATLLLVAPPSTADAPIPTAEALARMTAEAPKPRQPAMMVSYAELRCLALNVYWEARGQPEEGQAAVAHVTLNRVGAESFPATICGVVQQGGNQGPCQFGWYCDGRSDDPTDERAWNQAQAVAVRALAGEPDPTGGALYFHNTSLSPKWAQAVVGRRVIGDHVFFRLRRGELGEQLADDPNHSVRTAAGPPPAEAPSPR